MKFIIFNNLMLSDLGPRACYDEGKRVSETLSYAYAKHEKVSVRVARIFNTHGPRMHMNDGRVVSNFIVQALRNEPITVNIYIYIYIYIL
jgi:UDP-glucuronate decarboxylase